MSFASLPFVGLVTAGVVLYYLVPKRVQWVVLLLASMVFYLVGGVKSAVWLVLIAGLTWLAGLLLESRTRVPHRIRRQRLPCAARRSASARRVWFSASGCYIS